MPMNIEAQGRMAATSLTGVVSRTCVKTADGVIEMVDLEVPEPRDHEALVAIRMATVCGSDLHYVDDWPMPKNVAHLTMGHEMVATVVAVGVSVPALATLDIGAAFLFAIGAFTRSSTMAQEQAQAARARAESLLAQLRAAQAAQAEAVALTERTRLAREIHDILAHALSGLVLALDTMELLGAQARPAQTRPAQTAGQDDAALNQLLEQVTRAGPGCIQLAALAWGGERSSCFVPRDNAPCRN